MTLCVYAIGSPVRGRLSITGLAGESLTTVRVGALAAFVGAMPRVPKPGDDHLRDYDRILKTLSRRSAALLPARYGTRVRDRDELHVILSARQASLRRQLRQVRGRVQMTVRMVTPHTPDTPVARALSRSRGEPNKARPTGRHSGSEYLRARARESARQRDIPQFKPLRLAVRRWVRAERVEKRGSIATVYHLIPRGSAAAYRRALARRAAENEVRVVISGPWPPYAFADPLEL